MPKLRSVGDADVAAPIAVAAETGSKLVALSGKISELSRSPLEIVIPITQAMLDDRSTEDA
jgi:hypothetical protein